MPGESGSSSRSSVGSLRRALLLGVSGLALAVATTARPALAVNECGPGVSGGTVTCNHDGVPATDANPYPNGITYNDPAVVDLTVVVTKGAVIDTTGAA